MGQGNHSRKANVTLQILLHHKTSEVAWWHQQARRNRVTAPDGKKHQNSSKRNYAQAWKALTRLTRSLASLKARRNT